MSVITQKLDKICDVGRKTIDKIWTNWSRTSPRSGVITQNSDKNWFHKIIGNMHTESLQKVKKAKVMQRRIKAKRHILTFVAISRDHAPNHRSCRYLAWTRSNGRQQAKPGEHILSLFCVITLRLGSPSPPAEADFVAILRDHVMFGEISIIPVCRLCRYFAWSRPLAHTLTHPK